MGMVKTGNKLQVKWLASLCVATVFTCCMGPGDVCADGGYLSMGIGGGPKDVWSWQSITWAPFTPIDDTGLMLRAAVRSETKTYVTELPGRTDVRIWAQGIGGDAELGWQWVEDWGSVAAFAGLAWRDYILSPVDPNSKLASNDYGAKVSLQGNYHAFDNIGVFGYGEYLVGFETWFVEARPYYELDNGVKFGPEFSISSGADYLHARTGLFVSGYELDVPWVGLFWVGASVGALIDTDTAEVTPYAGFNLTRRFSGF